MILACLAGCGGGGGDSSARPPPPVANCPTNRVPVGSACACPAGLVENPDDGYCTDVGGTVLRGVEYLEPGFPVLAATAGGFGFQPIYTKVVNIDDDPELEIFHKDAGTEFLAWNHDGTPVQGYSVYATTAMHGKMVLAQLDADANDELPGFPLETTTFREHQALLGDVDGEIFFAVGDVIGGNAQEIVSFRNAITTPSISPVVHLVMYQADGSPIDIEVTIDEVGDPGSVMPTIADIDLDGRNEVIVTGDHWNGTARDYYKVWVFDFGAAATNGTVEWGQKFGDRHNSGAHSTARDSGTWGTVFS